MLRRLTVLSLLLLLVPTQTARAQPGRPDVAAQHAAIERCYAAALDDLGYPGRDVPVDCPAFFERDHAYVYETTDLRARRVASGNTFAIHWADYSPCGGVAEGHRWLNPAGVDAARVMDEAFSPNGHDTRRDVVYGLLPHQDGSHIGPMRAVRFATASANVEALDRSCFSLILVPEADAWVCERGDGEVEAGPLALDTPLPPARAPIEERSLSMNAIEHVGFALGGGLALVRRFGPPSSFDVQHRIIRLPLTTQAPTERFTPEVTRAGALLDLAHVVDGPFTWFRDALARYATRHGMAPAGTSWPTQGVVVFDAVHARVHAASATTSLEPLRARLGLPSLARDDVSIGAAWAGEDGRLVGPLDGWARRLAARSVPTPLAIELGIRVADARFFVTMVVRVSAQARVDRFVALFRREDADAYVEPVDATRARVTFVFDEDALPSWLASELPFPMADDVARRLASELRAQAAESRRWDRRTSIACARPVVAGLAGDFEALAAVDEPESGCATLEDADAHALARVLARTEAACRREDDDACHIWHAFREGALGDDAQVASCERTGGALCRWLLVTMADTTRVRARVEADCARGRPADCRALVTAAQNAGQPAEEIARRHDVACAAGDVNACAGVAVRERSACGDATHCEVAARRMIDACTSGSSGACSSLRSDRRWIRLVGLAPGGETTLRIHRGPPRAP